jgi:hypothetical protein
VHAGQPCGQGEDRPLRDDQGGREQQPRDRELAERAAERAVEADEARAQAEPQDQREIDPGADRGRERKPDLSEGGEIEERELSARYSLRLPSAPP